jgi:hypothetical protein
MLAALFALALTSPANAPSCATTFIQCADTRALTANPNFQPTLRAFLGDSHERLLHGDKPLYDQVLDMLATPETQAPRVAQDYRLYAGCRKGSCPEKAAVIIGPKTIRAVGVIDYSKGDAQLEVIIRRADPAAKQITEALTAWGNTTITRQSDIDHTGMRLQATRVRTLDTAPAVKPTTTARATIPPHL